MCDCNCKIMVVGGRVNLFVNMTESSHKNIYIEENDGVSARNLYKICYEGDTSYLKSVKKSESRWQSSFGFFSVLIVLFTLSVKAANEQ